MNILIQNRTFENTLSENTLSFLETNSHIFVKEKFEIHFDFSLSSSNSDMWTALAANKLQAYGGTDFATEWYAAGQTVLVEFFDISSGTTFSQTATISAVNGDTITFTTNVFSSHVGKIFPMIGVASVMTISLTSSPAVPQLDVYHNLIENNATFSRWSLIDGEQNLFRWFGGVSNQLGYMSGGGYASHNIVWDTDHFDVMFEYIITDIENQFDVPTWLAGSNTLKSVLEIVAYRLAGNLNAAKTLQDAAMLGNVGYIDEIYNGNPKYWTIIANDATDGNGNAVGLPIYNDTTHYKLTIDNEFTNYLVSAHIIPVEGTLKNKQTSFLDNIAFAQYESIGGTYTSYSTENRVITLSNVTLSGQDIEFDIDFSPEIIDYFNEIDEAERLVRITVSFYKRTILIPSTGNFTETCLVFGGSPGKIEMPPDLLGFNFYDLTNKQRAKFCTEDLVLVKINKHLTDAYDTISAKILIRGAQGDFTAIERTINLSQFPVNNGDYVIQHFEDYHNFQEEDQNLSAFEDQIFKGGLIISANDAISFPFTLDWRYWLAQLNATPEFIDFNLPHNGRNREIERYIRAGADVYVAVALKKQGQVVEYGEQQLTIQDYEFNLIAPEITTIIEIFDSNGVLVPHFTQGDGTYIIRATHTFNTSISGGTWGYIAIRNFETDPRNQINSEHYWSSINAPLMPDPPALMMSTQAILPNVVRTWCAINTAGITGSKVTVVARIGETVTSPYPMNVQTRDYDVKKKPITATTVDDPFNLNVCSKPIKVLADANDPDPYKNDFTGIFDVGSTIQVFLQNSAGVRVPALGTTVSFPNDQNAVGFIIDWRQHLPYTGCYDVIAIIDGTECVWGSYHLMNFNGYSSQADVRVSVYLDDYSVKHGINFRGSGFKNSLRFGGFFGEMQPNFEVEEIIKIDRVRKTIRTQAIRSYQLTSDAVSRCITYRLDEEMLLLASNIKVSDYNVTNHACYNEKGLILDPDSAPKFKYTDGSMYASVSVEFNDKEQWDELRYKEGISAPYNNYQGGQCC